VLEIRLASDEDILALRELIGLSVRALQSGDYSAEQIEGALGTVFGVDRRLIADGTYFVAEANGILAGCGGWSKRRTLFGSDRQSGREDALLDPLCENARIRAFFVHPEWARRGVGSRILAACESAAMDAGFSGFELGATVTGERLYSKRGYKAVELVETPLANGLSLRIIRMVKKIGAVRATG
jgi:GNAT superfamily N-acetyltransferase